MGKIIGFDIAPENISTVTNDSSDISIQEMPKTVCSVVKVHFFERDVEYPYYNDKFDLSEGDIVYVEGKLEGLAGEVTSVTTHYKVSLDYYKKVIAKLDLSIHGKYTIKGPLAVCFDDWAVSSAQFESWVRPPRETPEEFFVGSGFEINPLILPEYDFITQNMLSEGLEYLMDNHIKYLSISDNCGHAFAKGSAWHKIDFTYNEGIVTDMYCDCISADFCVHEIAVCILLKHLPEILKADNLPERIMVMDRNMFFQILQYKAPDILL